MIEIEGDKTNSLDGAEENIIQSDGILQPPHIKERYRKRCFDFCYFDRDYEVYSDEEGIKKGINGYLVGEFSVTT